MSNADKPVVLIVDDNIANIEVLGAALANDYDIRFATGGAEGLALAKRAPPDLILLDVMMPGMDGFETCQRLRANPQMRDTPVIFISALDAVADKVKAFKVGGSDYVTKPFQPEEVQARVSTHVNLYRARRKLYEREEMLRRNLAQLEAANKELDAFAYSVSHDLRAPLRHIDGFLGLLKARAVATLDDKSLHYMDTIAAAAKRMGTLIDDLLSFSRMGRSAMAAQRVELAALVQEVIQELGTSTTARAIDWRIGELPVVTGDRAMLRVALVNLIANALKFTQKREKAEIEISSQSAAMEDVIFVRDNGVGFDMQYVNKLFGVFQRLHRADEFEGTGIGLANVRRVITRHGGRTWAEGKVDGGATFYFTLPKVSNVSGSKAAGDSQ